MVFSRLLLLSLFFLATSFPPGGFSVSLQAQNTPPPPLYFISPQSGNAVQGVVSIAFSSAIPTALRTELAFRYRSDPRETWFLIWEGNGPPPPESLFWDTSELTDGEYDLRIRVFVTTSEITDALIRDVRVRNYTPIETATPAPSAAALQPVDASPSPSPSLTPTPPLLPGELSPNPISLTLAQIGRIASLAAVGVLAFFFILGLYYLLRSSLRQ